MTGDHFELLKKEGRWHWHLQGSHYPAGPIAQSGQGYDSRSAAMRSMESARRAMLGAVEGDGKIRVERRNRGG